MENQNVWASFQKSDVSKADQLAKDYMAFLDHGKTERECVDTIVNEIETAGYVELNALLKKGGALKAGDKVYAVWMNKTVVMFQMGEEPFEQGMNILGAHIDSPRLDVKQNPLYESDGIAYLDTHYYGGIKKYQWVAIPLALHGVMVKTDGTTVEIHIGEEDDDPVFFVSDILVHLAGEQLEKKAAKVIEGEALDLIIGSKPICIGDVEKEKQDKEEDCPEDKKEAKDAVKQGILAILKEQYGVEEEDFLSAELEIVPAGRAREAGLDRSMVLAYGQDDRVCAYTSYQAMLELPRAKRTACCILSDKEETGSVGATGMRSKFFENTLAEVMNLAGEYSELSVRRCLAASTMLSSDVSAAFDPTYASVFEKKNAAFLGNGMVFNKFTGSRGKSGSNDANAEFMAYIRKVFEQKQIHFQTAELGKVDAGGGGTIAYILALYGMNVIDSGVAVLNMHAPWEATSKADIYETKRGYLAFLEGAGL